MPGFIETIGRGLIPLPIIPLPIIPLPFHLPCPSSLRLRLAALRLCVETSPAFALKLGFAARRGA